MKTFRFAEAGAYYRSILSSSPDDIYTLNALAMLEVEELGIEKALPKLKRVAEITNDPLDWSEYISYSTHVGEDREALKYWKTTFADPLFQPAPMLNNTKLRTGYVGDVFFDHACSRVLLPHLQKKRGEIIIFSDSVVTDQMTDKIKALAQTWHDTSKLDDQQLADLIRSQKIDTIVDLQGHKKRSRLLALARNPAPQLCTFIGYFGETWITENMDDLWDWEYYCGPLPPVLQLPRERNYYVTYGSVHRAAKINTETLNRWGQILQQDTTAKLKVVCMGGERNLQARYRLISSLGIDGRRLELINRFTNRASYLSFFNSIDFHLEASPYPGGATTFDSRAMGREVV